MPQVGAGAVPYPHDLLRQVASLVSSQPAMNTAAFRQDFLTEYNNTLLTVSEPRAPLEGQTSLFVAFVHMPFVHTAMQKQPQTCASFI